jgi:hypothetical protein
MSTFSLIDKIISKDWCSFEMALTPASKLLFEEETMHPQEHDDAGLTQVEAKALQSWQGEHQGWR